MAAAAQLPLKCFRRRVSTAWVKRQLDPDQGGKTNAFARPCYAAGAATMLPVSLRGVLVIAFDAIAAFQQATAQASGFP